jgi:type VI secretion system protein VasD
MEIYRTLTNKTVPILLLCLAVGSLQGCGSAPKTRLEASLVAADDVNLEKASGRSLPIVVRIYELKSTGAFDGADFYSIYDKETETLGGDLLAREEVSLRSGQQHQIEREAAPEAQFVGVVAAFRDIDGARWKATHPLQTGETNKLEIQLGPSAVSIR